LFNAFREKLSDLQDRSYEPENSDWEVYHWNPGKWKADSENDLRLQLYIQPSEFFRVDLRTLSNTSACIFCHNKPVVIEGSVPVFSFSYTTAIETVFFIHNAIYHNCQHVLFLSGAAFAHIFAQLVISKPALARWDWTFVPHITV
jgi:hypothetical protein